MMIRNNKYGLIKKKFIYEEVANDDEKEADGGGYHHHHHHQICHVLSFFVSMFLFFIFSCLLYNWKLNRKLNCYHCYYHYYYYYYYCCF
jgi:hypothetical protein